MGFEATTGLTDYDMIVYLTPLGADKFFNGGFMDSISKFSISDGDANYLAFQGFNYNYSKVDGGDFSKLGGGEPQLGHILNLRGDVDRGKIIKDRALLTNIQSIREVVWKNSDDDTFDGDTFLSYKMSKVKPDAQDKPDKYFGKPIILGGRNMWHSGLSDTINSVESFLYYEPPTEEYEDYIDFNEPTIGMVTTGATDHVPFPGVNVTDSDTSWTETQYFYVVNATKDTINITSIALRNIMPISHKVSDININENYSSEFVEVKYYLEWDALKNKEKYIDGYLRLLIPKEIYKKYNTKLKPYETTRFGVSFHIVNAGSKIGHWHGQTYTQPTAEEGKYMFTFSVMAQKDGRISAGDLPLNVIQTTGGSLGRYDYLTDMDVVVKVKEKGYFPIKYKPPYGKGDGGGTIGIE